MSFICLAAVRPRPWKLIARCPNLWAVRRRGPVFRLHIREDMECSKGDVLIFDFNLVPNTIPERDPK